MTEGNWINLDALQLWERNYNRGDVAKIKRSVKKFGFNNALRVWNGTVMAGNHSTKALRELKSEGWTPAGGAIRVEGDAWLVQSVDLSHLRKDEAESFAIADNHIATEADPDMAALTALLKELELSMPDVVADIGFDQAEFERLTAALTQSGEGDWSAALGGLATGDRAPFQQMTFTLHDEQANSVKGAIELAKKQGDFIDSQNENSNGNALARICETYITLIGAETDG